MIALAHVLANYFDDDKDVMLAIFVMLFPNKDKIGVVIILENDGTCKFKKHLIADQIAPVTDVRAGDKDLAVLLLINSLYLMKV
jgi:hypothetical protein